MIAMKCNKDNDNYNGVDDDIYCDGSDDYDVGECKFIGNDWDDDTAKGILKRNRKS